MVLATTELLIDLHIKSLITSRNHSIYEKRLRDNVDKYDLTPHCVYFYYWRFGEGGQPIVTRYDFDNGNNPIPYNNVEGRITQLAQNARTGGSNPNPATDVNAPWERKSYIAIVMDSPYWRFVRLGPNNEVALAFNPSKGSTNNHSFFDAADMNIDINGDQSEYVSGVYLVNHMKKNDSGEDIKYKPDGVTRHSQKFVYDLFYEVRTGGAGTNKYIHDPTGTNLGPPTSPP